MSTSQRSILAAAGPDPALPHLAMAEVGAELAVLEISHRSAEGNSALMRGDIESYLELVPLADDFLLMSPFGGTPTRGSEYTPERIEAIGRFFRNGTFAQEVVQAYASADMVVLAIIERANVEVGGLPAQEWALRVTLVYRREGLDWRLAHRHADPLANGVTLEQAAALGRGEAAFAQSRPASDASG